MKNKILSILVAGLLLIGIGSSSIVSAATIYTDGGTWNYGVGSKYVWSYYSNNYRYHSSTAIGKTRSFSGFRKPGVRALASSEKRWWWRNEAYYNVY